MGLHRVAWGSSLQVRMRQLAASGPRHASVCAAIAMTAQLSSLSSVATSACATTATAGGSHCKTCSAASRQCACSAHHSPRVYTSAPAQNGKRHQANVCTPSLVCVCVYYMQGTCLECDEERPPRAALAGHRLPEHLARRRRRRRPQLEPAYVLAQRDNAAAELPETHDRLTTLRPESC